MPYHKQPTLWPNGAYYFLRALQTIASAGVLGGLAYFVIKVIKDGTGIPHEFIVLIAVSVISLINIVASTIAKCCNALSPKIAFLFDSIILIGFIVAFAFITRSMGPVLFASCTNGTWGSSAGNGPWHCKIYKAVWAFALAAILFYIGSLILDLVVSRRARHKYIPANPKGMMDKGSVSQFSIDYTQNTSYGAGQGQYAGGGIKTDH